jgi:hypothetical protein
MTIREQEVLDEQAHQMRPYMTHQEADNRIRLWYRWVLSLNTTSTQIGVEERPNTETVTQGFAGTVPDAEQLDLSEQQRPTVA